VDNCHVCVQSTDSPRLLQQQRVFVYVATPHHHEDIKAHDLESSPTCC
jgi:hypothetical protein